MKVAKKHLSVLLAVIMIMTSMSVCFGTFAAGGTVQEGQWNALMTALQAESIKSPSFRTVDGKYILDDPDGTVLTAVEAYWSVFDTLANKAPATGSPSGTSNVTGSTEGNRTIQQVNTSIKKHIEGMAGYQAYMGTFVGNLISHAPTVSLDTDKKETSNSTTVPATTLSDIGDISLTVVSSSAVTGYTLEELKDIDSVVTEKTFTVKHSKDRYDYTYNKTSGTNGKTTRTYYFYYYISGAPTSNGAAVSTKTITDAASTLTTYADYFTADLKTLVSKGTSTLNAVSKAVNDAKDAVEKAFSSAIWTHFFKSYDVDALDKSIDLAKEIITKKVSSDKLTELVNGGYAGYDKAQLETLLGQLQTNLSTYDSASPAAKDYIVAEGFDRDDVVDFIAEVEYEIDILALRELKATIDNTVTPYYDYDDDNVTDGTVQEDGTIVDSTVTSAMLNIAVGNVDGWIGSLNTYTDEQITSVWGNTAIKTELADLSAELHRLVKLAGHNDSFASKYAEYVTVVYSSIDLGADSEELFGAIKGYDSWYTGVKNLIATIETEYGAELAAKVLDDLDAAMVAHIDSKYNVLHERVFAQIDLADKLYKVLVADGKISVLNLNTYAAFEDALGHVDVDLYNFLLNSANFDMPQLTIDEFNEIWTLALGEYHDFLTSGGFNKFEQTEIPDIVRPESEDLHDAHKGDYTVTDEKVEGIIDLIEGLLADEDIKALLGDLINKDKETGEPTGEPFDLVTLINGLLEGIYTDEIINSIVQYVYPLVAKEFAKVWAGIDPHVVTKADVMSGVSADIDTNLNLYDVETAIAGVGIYLAPKTLAAHLKAVPEYAVYTDVISVLESGKTVTKYDFKDKANEEDDVYTDAWADAELYINVLDENGEPVLNDDGTNKTQLNLDWGIENATDKRAAFIDAACAALSGLEPLLFALLSNEDFVNPNTSTKPDDVRGCKIGVSGSPSTANVMGLATLDLVLDPITLMFDITGNDGYDNVLAPIFEALGCENIPHGEDLTTTRKILEDGLFGMLDQVIAKVAANPLETILEILPNLAYALSVDRIKPLLKNLEIEIYYEADAYYSADIPWTLSWLTSMFGLPDPVTGAMQGAMKAEKDKDGDGVKEPDPVKINIGDMIKLDDMGIDLSFAGIWDMIMGMLPEGVTLPAPNAGYIATLGKLKWNNTNRSVWTYTPVEAGKAAYIEANKADVLIYLLRYLLNTLSGNPDLLASFGLELSDDVKNIIAGVTANPDKTIAAIVELLNAVEYDTLKEYVWYASELSEDTVVGLTPAIQKYLGYDNDWSKTKADYIIENVDEIITAVLAMVNDGKAEDEKVNFSISETLTGLISGLFTNKTVTALAKALGGLDLNALLAGDDEAADEEVTEGEDEIATVEEGEEAEDEEASEEAAIDINDLVAKFAGIDLSVYAQYAELTEDDVLDWGFEDGDKDGFVNAIVALLEPLQPVLDFILAGENLALLDGDVELIGYNGYDSAIIPILEALGATPAALEDGDNALVATINALLARVESLDSVDAILDLIPGVLYFIKSNGLTTAVRNLLQPVLVILETIDPIYAVNLNEIIGGLTTELGFSINLDNLSFEAIFDILPAFVDLDLSELEEIIDDVCEVIVGETYTSKSSLIGENGKKGAYGEFFDKADLVTVLVSFALTWLQEEGNADAIVSLIAGDDAEKAAEIAKYINGAIVIINGIDPEYEAIDWAYNFPEGFDEAIFESGITIQPTINTITYPTNWTEDAAEYIAENLDEIADEVIANVEIEDVKYESIAALVDAKVNIYTAANVDAIVKVVADLLKDIDKVLIDTVGVVLDVDLDALTAYKADEGIDTAEEFAAALTEVLAKVQPVVDWLLFGEDYAFFSESATDAETGETVSTDLVTIKGAEGYAYGLAPILEALGVEAPAKDEATVANVLEKVFARVDAILADPVNKVFEILPNVMYFLNANGVSTSVKNLLAGVSGLMGTVQENFGVEVDLMKIINDAINGFLPEDTTVTLDVENLDLESIFTLVQELLGLDLTPIADILIDLCVGQIVAYTSASGEYGFKMLYTDDFARYDMVTIIVSCLLQIVKLEANEEALKEMLGEGIYEGILNVISLDVNLPVQDFEWALTDKADTGEVFSAIQTSEMFAEFQYGPLYTKDMEQYIGDNFGYFVDNIIYLLGIEVNGESVNTLADLLGGLVGGSVYNSNMIVTIRDAIAGLAGTLEESLPAGSYILEILKLAEIADLKAVAAVEVAEFTDDRDAFVAALCDVLEPLFPVLEWLLADTDLTFFVDENKDVVVTLPGAEGYAYGLIPVLEAFQCEGIVAPADYYTAIANGDADTVITAIIDPLLDKVDDILANPAEEILAILPNLIYFINSNGVDTVVKNTLNAVYTLLNAIEPIAKVDLYELIGIDLATIDFEWLIDKVIELIKNSTGFTLDALKADTVTELTTGTLESYTSANGKTAYRMVYQPAELKGEMVTVVLRLALMFIAHEDNLESIMGILRDNFNMDADAEKYLRGVIESIINCLANTRLGMDQALATVYYIFFGLKAGVDGTVGGIKDLNAEWKALLEELGYSDDPNKASIGNIIIDILDWADFDDILDENGIASRGFLAFFKKIIDLFNRFIEFFKNLFN